ncbi:MAG TPA: hypothetical protein VGE41_08665 [Verrucomicrobiae bacterium]
MGSNTKAARKRHSEPDEASGCAGALAKAFPEIEFAQETTDHHRQQALCFAEHTARSLELKDDLPRNIGRCMSKIDLVRGPLKRPHLLDCGLVIRVTADEQSASDLREYSSRLREEI